MDDCPNMSRCTFFIAYGNDGGHRAAVAGFIRLYCKGEKQTACARKKVSASLGGPDKVPSNMLPNGAPVSGTNSSAWPEEVKRALK